MRGRHGEGPALVQGEPLGVAFPEIEDQRLAARKREAAAPSREAEARAAERVHPRASGAERRGLELGRGRRELGLAGRRGGDQPLVGPPQDQAAETERSSQLLQHRLDRRARGEARGGPPEHLQVSPRPRDLLGGADPSLPERGGDEAARGEREERTEVTRLVDLEGHVGLGQEEVQAERGDDGGGQPRPPAAHLGHDDGQRDEDEGEIRGGHEGSKRCEGHAEGHRPAHADDEPHRSPVILAHGPPRCAVKTASRPPIHSMDAIASRWGKDGGIAVKTASRLSLDAAGGEPLDHVVLEVDVRRDDRQRREHRARHQVAPAVHVAGDERREPDRAGCGA